MAILNTAGIRRWWGPACQSARGVIMFFHGAGRALLDRRAADAFKALNACLAAWNYQTRRADTGGYNCRPITGGSLYSPHAFLVALDVNWTSNPYGSRLRTDMPAAMVGAILAIRTNSGAQVFRWGGFYSTNKDAMHYEIVCTPAELASGIRWSTVPKAPGVPASDPWGWVPLERYGPGSGGPKVAQIQFALNILRPLTGRGDLRITDPAGYGSITTSVVRSFQEFARAMQVLSGERREAVLIDVDGVWGPQTGQAAKFWIPSALAK